MLRKNRFLTVFGLVFAFLWLPLGVKAQETGTVTIQPTYDRQAVTGGDMAVYQVARLAEDDPFAYALLPAFAEAQISLTASDVSANSAAYAERLSAEVTKAKPVFQTAAIPSEGVTISGLEQGIYLFVQSRAAEGYEVLKPFLLTVPKDGQYTITAVEKMSPLTAKPRTVTPDPTARRARELPFTGQLWWPVYLLLISGIICLSLSFTKRRSPQ